MGGAVLATAVVALAAPGMASALKARSVTTTTMDANDLLAATAECKQGEHVISGGFSSDEESAAVISRAIKGRKWTVSLFAGTPTPSLTVSAYCSGSERVSRHSSSEDAPADPADAAEGEARCDSGESVVSGGHELAGLAVQDNSPVFSSRRAGKRGWSISVFVANPPATLKTFAYCQRHVDVKVRSQQGDPIPDNGNGSVSASCHKGEKLLSGGYTTTPESDFSNDFGPDFFFYRSSRSGRRQWTASAHNYSNIAGQITTFAYCKA